MAETTRSLMDFVQMPMLVGDPDGRAVYVNPAFETDFLIDSSEIVGQPLANLFDGGGREAVLAAVAEVCSDSETMSKRFGLLASERAYQAMVSAVEAEGGRVGVILVLTPESASVSRVYAFRREILGPLDELSACFAMLAEHAGQDDALQLALADGVRHVERMRKWAGVVAAGLEGKKE
jgi:nitrogen-specific signal transduction histidine kinase